MWSKVSRAIVLVVLFISSLSGIRLAAQQNDAELLRVRESVWRAWFDNDAKTLERLVPPGTIVISSGEKEWKDQAEFFALPLIFRPRAES